VIATKALIRLTKNPIAPALHNPLNNTKKASLNSSLVASPAARVSTQPRNTISDAMLRSEQTYPKAPHFTFHQVTLLR